MNSGWRKTIPALVLLAIAVRGLSAAGLAVIPRDGTVYVTLARTLTEEGPAAAFEGRQHPLYPLAVGLFGGSELAATLLSILAGALAVPAVFLLCRRLHSRALGIIGALLYAVAPALVRYGSAPLLEGLSVPLYLWALERALAGADRPLNGLWAGLFAGASYLARPEALEIVFVLPLGLAVLGRWRSAVLLVLGFLVVGGPYAAWLTKEEGTPTLSRKKPAGRFLSAEEGFEDHMALKERRTGISRPGIGAALWETVRSLGEAGSWVIPIVAVFGAFLLLRGPPRGPALLLLALLALDLFVRFRLVYLHGYLAERHMVLATCILLPFAGAGIAFLARRRVAAATGLVVAVLLVLAVLPREHERIGLKEAGIWIREQSGPGAAVATLGRPRIPYYAEGTDVALAPPGPDFAELPVEAQREYLARVLGRADWVALADRDGAEIREIVRRYLGRDPDGEFGARDSPFHVRVWRAR